MKIDSKISKSSKSISSGKDRKQNKDLKPITEILMRGNSEIYTERLFQKEVIQLKI